MKRRWQVWLGSASALILLGCQTTPTEPNHTVDGQFLAWDKDGDERIELETEALHAPDRGFLVAADLDQDGWLTRDELIRYQERQQPLAQPQPGAALGVGNVPAGQPTAEARRLPEPDPERTQRAREIYLSGARLLESSPPQVDQAIREFQQALAIDPLYHRAHFKLGICYYHRGLYDLEITEYRKCLAINSQFVPAWLNLGHAHLARDELEKAREAYERVLDLEPHHSVALYNKALVEFDLHNEEESLRLFRSFLEVDGNGEMGDRARRYVDELERRPGGGF